MKNILNLYLTQVKQVPVSEFITMIKSDFKPVFQGTHYGCIVFHTEPQWKEFAEYFQIESELIFDYVNLTVKMKED